MKVQKDLPKKKIEKDFSQMVGKDLKGIWLNKMTKIIFIEDGKEKTVEAQNGLSILEVAHNNGINLEGACEGSLACSTCHVVVEKKFFDETIKILLVMPINAFKPLSPKFFV